jgi:hypothetical protein
MFVAVLGLILALSIFSCSRLGTETLDISDLQSYSMPECVAILSRALRRYWRRKISFLQRYRILQRYPFDSTDDTPTVIIPLSCDRAMVFVSISFLSFPALVLPILVNAAHLCLFLSYISTPMVFFRGRAFR